MVNAHRWNVIAQKYGRLILIPLWIAVQVATCIFITGDIVEYFDTPRYLTLAKSLSNGTAFHDPGESLLFLSYGLFINAVYLFDQSSLAIIIGQYLLSFITFLFFLNWLRSRTDTIRWFLAGLLYILMIDLHLWNAYLMTESLFISVSLVAFFLFFGRPYRGRVLLLFAIMLFLLFIRPQAVAFILALLAALYGAITWLPSRSIKVALGVILVLSVFGSAFLLPSFPEVFPVKENYQQGNVLSGRDATTYGHHSLLNVTAPKAVSNDQHLDSPLVIARSFVQHPGYYASLWLKRALAWAIPVRPHFSVAHNIFIFVLLIPVYYLFARNLITANSPHQQFILILFLLNLAIAVFIYPVWSGRFFWPMYPFLVLGAFAGPMKTPGWLRTQ